MKSISNYLNLVAFSHSVFALPFAVASFVLAWRKYSAEQYVLTDLFSIVALMIVAIISARSAAMSFNRIVDRDIDALNPRTADRELPSKKMSLGGAIRLCFASCMIFIISSFALGAHCGYLSPLVLGALLFYSYTKRFTRYCHLVLGVCLALAPGGAWWIISPSVEWTPVVLMLAVMTWVFGFDVMYSCQDAEFDKEQQLFSLPVALGIEKSLLVSKGLHVATSVLLLAVGLLENMGFGYYFLLAVIAALLIYQHSLIKPYDLSKIDRAFLTANGTISFVFLLAVIIG